MASLILFSAPGTSWSACSFPFQSYRIEIDQGVLFERRASHIRSLENQQKMIAELKNEIESSHSFMKVMISDGQCLPACYREAFEVVVGGRDIYFLGPKVMEKDFDPLTNKTHYVYANGVKEESVLLADGSRKGERKFPDTETVEAGIFKDLPNLHAPRDLNQPFSGVRTTLQGKTYVCPKKWFHPINLCAHAYVDSHTRQLVPTAPEVCWNPNYRPIYLIESETAEGDVQVIPVFAPARELSEVEYAECTEFSREDILAAIMQSSEWDVPDQLAQIETWFNLKEFLEFIETPNASFQGDLPCNQIQDKYLPMIASWGNREFNNNN